MELGSIKVGSRYVFAYPSKFTTLPEYTARAGQVVMVIRPCTPDEAEPPCYEEGITQMFIIRADDGWEGNAWEEELEPAHWPSTEGSAQSPFH